MKKEWREIQLAECEVAARSASMFSNKWPYKSKVMLIDE
jgi:hypothetical protein